MTFDIPAITIAIGFIISWSLTLCLFLSNCALLRRNGIGTDKLLFFHEIKRKIDDSGLDIPPGSTVNRVEWLIMKVKESEGDESVR